MQTRPNITCIKDLIAFIIVNGSNLGHFTEISMWSIEREVIRQGGSSTDIRQLMDIAIGVGVVKECGGHLYLQNTP